MITAQMDCAPEHLSPIQPNREWRDHLPSTAALYGHQRAPSVQEATANIARKVQTLAAQVQLASCDAQNFAGHDGDHFARLAADVLVTADKVSVARGVIAGLNFRSMIDAINRTVTEGYDRGVGLSLGLSCCDAGGDLFVEVHLSAPVDNCTIGPLALSVNRGFA